MMIDKMIITGCDSHTAWMLPWFMKNYNKFNTHIPLMVFDFGMNEDQKSLIPPHQLYTGLRLDYYHNVCKWFMKPEALTYRFANKRIWLDTDCEVLGNLDPIFNDLKPNVLNMIVDHPWKRRSGEKWHNSGVIGIIDMPSIVCDWSSHCLKTTLRGDQEVLHDMKRNWGFVNHINDLPHRYNVLRLDVVDNNVPDNPLIMHWTGRIGKEIIKSKMNNLKN